MRIGSILGIRLLVNPLFVLLLVIVTFHGKLLPTLLLFSIVLWHEAAHTLAARYYGLRVREIELLPFGGVAKIDDFFALEPRVEAWIALVGPLSNLILLAGVWIYRSFFASVEGAWFAFFAQANISMALINLIPALPLDGGRLLRSQLMGRYGYRQATQIAAIISQGVALIMVGFGIGGYLISNQISSSVFAVLGIFIFMCAKREKSAAIYTFLRYLTNKQQQVQNQQVMPIKELMATMETSIGEVVDYITPSHYHLIWVLNNKGELEGIVTELELINGLLELGIHGKVNRLVNYKF